MKILLTLLILLVLAAVVAFVVLNWSAFIVPTSLSLGVAFVEAPLGLIMLGLAILLFLIVIVSAIAQRGAVSSLRKAALMESARHSEELNAQRRLAEQAEASRFTELRRFLEEDSQSQAERGEQLSTLMLTRVDEIESGLRSAMQKLDSIEQHLSQVARAQGVGEDDRKQLQTELDSLRSEIDRLKARALQSTGEERIIIQEQVETLEERSEQTEARMSELEHGARPGPPVAQDD